MQIGKDTHLNFEASVADVGDVGMSITQHGGPLSVHVTFDIDTAELVNREFARAIRNAKNDKESRKDKR